MIGFGISEYYNTSSYFIYTKEIPEDNDEDNDEDSEKTDEMIRNLQLEIQQEDITKENSLLDRYDKKFDHQLMGCKSLLHVSINAHKDDEASNTLEG